MRILEAKYNGFKGLVDGVEKMSNSIWWRDLKIICGDEQETWFDNLVEWSIDDGSSIRFWDDRWGGGECLENIFARIYLNSEQKGETINNMGRLVDGV